MPSMSSPSHSNTFWDHNIFYCSTSKVFDCKNLNNLEITKTLLLIAKKKIKILIWFDNGWGYSSRILETIKIYQKEDDTDE